MFVRHFVATCGLGLLLLYGLACRSKPADETIAKPPRDANVLLITLDTTRADHLSCYAKDSVAAISDRRAAMRTSPLQHAKTPHLDALAARGVRFAHATAQVPLTLPSHASIMTGTYPPVHKLRDMGGFILAKGHPTIASISSQAGFQTGAFIGSRVLARHFGISNGFATYDDEMGSQNEEGKLPGVFPERRAGVVTDRALDWLKQNGQRHFFLWAHYYDPHAPYDPPEPYKRAYANDLYSGEIAYTDEQVGRLLDGLDQMGLGSRTLIAVIGDHGESLGEHGELTHGVFLYDSTLHVPFLMAGPDVPQGKVIEDQVRSIDVMPTILEFLHLSPGTEAQGVSLWPLLERGTHVRSNFAYCETLYPRTYMGWSELRAMRTDQWKLIIAPHPELYNLERDPAESQNLISNFPAEADQLQKKVWEIAGTPSKQETVNAVPVDPQTRQELESLGYVSAGTPREIRLGTDAPDPKDRVELLKMIERVEVMMNKRNYSGAAALAEQAIKRDPTNPLCTLYLAVSAERMGNADRALQVYEQAVKMNLGTDQMYSRLGKLYLRRHQLPKAIEAMTHASEINPTDLDNLRNLGIANLQMGRVDDAEKAFKAITLQSDHYAPAYNGLGLVAIQRGNPQGARENFQKAIDLDDTQVEPLLNLGLLYEKTGDKESALRYYRKFLEKASREEYAEQISLVREEIQKLRGGA